MKRTRFLEAFVFLYAFLWAGGAVLAQTTGTLRGTVKDPSGAVIPGAQVTATQEGTNLPRTTASNASGDYEFAVLPVGRYTLEVQASGFKKYVQKGIELTLGHVVVINPQLQLGTVTEVVTAEAIAPLIETTSTQLGAVVNSLAVTQLPLNARDTYQLLQLQPGVQSQLGLDLFYGSDQAGVVSVNGGRGRMNNYTVNGGDANDQFANLPGVQPSPDTIQEFRVLTNTFDAEFGRNAGAVVNVVTKSGTNAFHGDLYEFFRNKVLNARGFFNVERPDFKQNQFGGTLGGPIKKDRTFFFASYEGRRIRRGTPSDVVTVPTVAERSGDFSAGPTFAGMLSDANVASILNARPGCAAAVAAQGGTAIASGTPYSAIFPNNKIPAPCFDPTAFDLLNQFVPLGNVDPAHFQSSPVAREYDDQFTGRIDHQINDHHQISGYYYFTDQFFTQPFSFFEAAGANVPGFAGLYNNRFQQINLTHTWTINATTVNELRFAAFREAQGEFNHPQHTNLLQDSCATVPARECFSDPNNPSLGITPFLGASHEGVPFISVSGGFNIGNNFEGELPQIGNSFEWMDNFSKVVGKHTLKFGADARRQRFDQELFFDVNGEFSYLGGGPNDPGFTDLFPNYLLGLPDSYGQGSAQFEHVRSTSVYLYGQDSWKIKPNVTLNYGLRWELNTPIGDVGKRIQTYRPGQATTVYPCQLSVGSAIALGFGPAPTPTSCNPGTPAEAVFPLGLVVPGDKGIPDGLTQTYYRSFAPRIGLAWSPDWSDGFLRALSGGPGNTSIRAGFGIFYNPVEQLVLEQFSAEPPFGGSTFLSNTLFNLPFEGQNGTPVPNPFHGVLDPPRGRPVDWSTFRPILLFGQFPPDMRSQYAEQYNFTIERKLTSNMILQVGYVGSQGHRLLASYDTNPGDPQTCLDIIQIQGPGTCGAFFADSSFFVPANSIPAGVTLHLPYGSVPTVTGPNNPAITLVGLRPFSSPFCQPTTGAGCPPDGVPVFSPIISQNTIANSNYNSLQVSLEKRFSRGLQFLAAYTWSKAFDNASSFENTLDPVDFRRSYSLSQYNANQRFVYSFYWELPVPKLQGFSGKALDGWALSGIATLQGGFPIRISSANDFQLFNSGDFEPTGEPNIVKPFRTLNPRGPNHQFFDPSIFADQALGTDGNSPRTVCCGPIIDNLDLAFLKDTPLTERTRVQFRAEFYDVLNHAQFFNPFGEITSGNNFGTVVRARDPRLVQFALKLIF